MTTAQRTAIGERVLELLRQIGLESDELSRDTRLRDIDVDSLDLVEVAHAIRKEHGIRLVGEDVQDVETVGDFIDAFCRRAP